MHPLRLACRTPWGTECDLLALRGRVIVPRELGHHPRLWWLRDERHSRVDVVTLCELERETDTEIGISPFCVPVERWNRAADAETWLPTVPTGEEAVVHDPDVTVLSTSAQLESLVLPNPPSRRFDVEFNGRPTATSDRLRAGSHAVSQLVAGAHHMVVAVGLLIAIAACAYYLASAGQWLWRLQDGMTGARVQEGMVLIVAALVLSRVTGAFKQRSGTPRDAWTHVHRRDRRERQPVLYTVLDAYRLGIALQAVAFAAFVIF